MVTKFKYHNHISELKIHPIISPVGPDASGTIPQLFPQYNQEHIDHLREEYSTDQGVLQWDGVEVGGR